MTAKWAAYRIVSYRSRVQRYWYCVHIFTIIGQANACFCFPICEIFTRYLHNYRSASVSRYAHRIHIELTSLPAPSAARPLHIDNSFSSLYLHCTIFYSDVQLLGIEHVDKLYWSSHSASFRLRTSIFTLYRAICFIIILAAAAAAVAAAAAESYQRLSAATADVLLRKLFINPAEATSVCSKLCPMSTESLDKLPETAPKSEKCDSHMTCVSHSWAVGGCSTGSWRYNGALSTISARHETTSTTKIFTTAFNSALV